MTTLWCFVLIEAVICIVGIILLILQQKKINICNNLVGNIEKQQKAFEQQIFEEQEKFLLTTKQQMFIHEANLLNEHGEWCLANDSGEKKYFKPGKISKVISGDQKEESFFEYIGDEVICTVTKNGEIKSELVFTKGGAPKYGKIFEDGKIIQEFLYNDLGQVERGN